jgi:nucleotidyltransferase AbiEii toxin of type IV toxin-antitoxin system
MPQGSTTVIVNLYEELVAIVRELEAAKLNYAVCGGMAVAIHGLARFTNDIDLLIQREDLKAVRDVVERCGFTLEGGILPMGAGEPIERDIFRISKVIDKELVTLDLLLANLPLQQAFESREYYEFLGQRLQAVSPAGLYLMKKIAGRPQDIVDLQRLGLWPHDSNP